MAKSFKFNSIAMSSYGLKVLNFDIPNLRQESESQLIQDISYSFKPKRPPKPIQLEVAVMAANRAILDGYLDSIKEIITTEISYKLEIDSITDRFWKAKLESLRGSYNGPKYWGGMIIFVADDPMAYGISEISSPHSINANPKTVEETTGGTGYINPVYTLTAKENLGTPTLKLENLTMIEELQWTGAFTTDDELEIDVATWVVKKNGAEATGMAGVVSGSKFPRLVPNRVNLIKVTNLYSSVAGNLNITYRNRFL